MPRAGRPPGDEAADIELVLGLVAEALATHPNVTRGGRGFGSKGLKVNGKLFALISSQTQFVAKLPEKRVDELVRGGHADPYDPGHGRLMKEWVAVDPRRPDLLELAREAHRFVEGIRP